MVLAPFSGAVDGTCFRSYLRLIDSCVTQLKAQGPSRTCNESKSEEEEEEEEASAFRVQRFEVSGRQGGVGYLLLRLRFRVSG